MAILLTSCVTIGPNVKADCKSKAIYTAAAFHDAGYPVRLARGLTQGGEGHIETQARIRGFWRWIDFNLGWSDTGPKDFKILYYYTLQEAFDLFYGNRTKN